MAQFALGTVDIVVFALTIVLSTAVGLYHAFRRRKTTVEYFLAGRKMHVLPVVLSLVVTFESSIFVMGYPAEVYTHGFTFWFYNIGQAFAQLIASRIAPKLFHPLGIKSVFEYLSLRFGNRKARMLAATLSILSSATYMGIVMIGPAIALKTLAGIPEWGTILLLAVAAVFYSTLGGIKAVIWTDVFQFVVIVAGIIAILVKGTLDAGGVVEVFEVNKVSGRLDIEFSPNPFIRHSVWTLVIGTTGRLLITACSSNGVQRSNSTRSEQDAKKVFQLATLVYVLLQTIVMVEGLVAYAYFSNRGCDPLRSKQITNPNEIIPFLIITLFGDIPGLTGLFLATLVSASLSTVSSLVNNMSVIATEDEIKPSFPHWTDKRLTIVAQTLVPVSGLLGVGVAFLTIHAKGSLSQIYISIMGATNGPIVGMFLLAIFLAWTTTEGVLFGGIVGMVFSVWLSLGYNTSTTRLVTPWLPLGPIHSCPAMNSSEIVNRNASAGLTGSLGHVTANLTSPQPTGVDWLYSVSYQYFALMTVIVTVCCGLAMSRLSRKVLKRYSHEETIDRKYLLSFRDRFLCCLPESFSKLSYKKVQKQSEDPVTKEDPQTSLTI